MKTPTIVNKLIHFHEHQLRLLQVGIQQHQDGTTSSIQ